MPQNARGKKPVLSVAEIVKKRAELREMLESYKRPVAIMFSDIKGSTAYFDQILFPIIDLWRWTFSRSDNEKDSE